MKAASPREIAQWFRELGGEVFVDEVKPDRPNVYGIWRGQTDRWVAVDVHTDTVGVEQMTVAPFSGEIRDGRVYGRGAVDTKATLGVVLALLESLQQRRQRPQPNLLIGATVDEEFGASGAPAFAAWIRQQPFTVDQLAVAEPTECVPVHGHKGVARFELAVEGKPSHSSQPDLGKNAIVAAAHIILAFQREHERLQTVNNTALGKAALTVSIIHGGTGINVVPDSCTLGVDRRVVDGESASAAIDDLFQIAQAACPLPLTIHRLRQLDAFLQPPDSPWLRQLAAWSGHTPAVAPYGTNAWAYKDLPGECVVIGPGAIAQAHGADEWVAQSQLAELAHIYAQWWGITV